MEVKLRSYPKYKDVNLPWLSRIPAHWDLMRMKYLFSERVQKGYPNEPLLSATQTKGVVRQEKYEHRTMTATRNFHSLKLVEPKDFVISLRSFEGGIEIAHDRGIISSAYTILKPGPQVCHGYFTHLFKSAPFIDNLSLHVTGIREGQNINYGSLSRSEIPVPPPEEQQAIGRYLDIKVKEATRLIRAKQRLIELLNEQKQAIIQRAVTRGLEPDVPMKSSGVDWLGDVPEHWEVRRLKYLCDIGTGGRDTVDRVENGEYPFFVRSQTPERINTYSYDGEAVLTAGDGAGVAKVFHYVNGKFDYHQRVYRFSDFREVLGKFFFYYVSSNLKYQVLRLSAKSTVDSLRLPMLQNFDVVLPPIIEQQEIVAFVEQSTNHLDAVIDRAQSEINLIREYRTRLIADVVTGKLDVRDVELPDEVEGVGVHETEYMGGMPKEAA